MGKLRRSAAALAARVLLHRLGPRALAANFHVPKAVVKPVALGGEVPLAELQGRRMQWTDGTTLPRYLVLVLALDPCRDFLRQLYRWEAHVYPDLRAP